jgi:subtilisin family serine protease
LDEKGIVPQSVRFTQKDVRPKRPKFRGYIVQFKERPLTEVWHVLKEKVGKREISVLEAEARFVSFKQTFLSTFEEHKESLRKIIPNFDKKFRREFKHVFNGMSLENVSPEILEKVKKYDFVKEVYPNMEVEASLMDSVPLIGADKVWNSGYTGDGTTIAIIDTGIDYTHPDFGGCFGEGCKVIGGYDFVNNDSDPMDDNGHGTHVAGIAASNGELRGVAPQANLLAYKVINLNGQGYSDWVISGIERSVDPNQDGDYSDHADVVSMSLGCFNPEYCHQDDPQSQAVDNAVRLGVVVVVAAGNDGSANRTISSPGTARKALTVGATYKKDYNGQYWQDTDPKVDQVISFSSRGPTEVGIKPDVVAPGALICSSRYDEIFPEGQHDYYQPCYDEKHVLLAGTSMSTPHVAGAAALIKQAHPDWNSEEIKIALRNTALDVGYDMYTQGYGRVDVLQAAQITKPPVAALYNPVKISGISFEIKGTAIGNSYTLYYTKGENPEAVDWIEICNGEADVSENTLCNWDIRYLEDGKYTLKLIVTNDAIESIEFGFVDIENAEITYPKDINSCFFGSCWEVFPNWKEIEIIGSATGHGFARYVIQWCDENLANCRNKNITLTNSGTLPIEQDLLGKWNVSSLTDADYYYLKLTVYYSNKPAQVESAKIHVDPTLHYGWPKKLDFSPLVQPTLEDIDNDGKKDMIVTGNKYIYVIKHDGTDIDGWPKEIDTYCGSYEGSMEIGPAVVDLDGDGYKEIVVGDTCGYLHVLKYNGFYMENWPKQLGDSPSIVSIKDVNKDGILEIIFGTYWNSGLYILKANGDNMEGFPKFLYLNNVAFNNNHRAVHIADLNNDGYEEMVLSISYCEAYPCPSYPEIILTTRLYVVDYSGNVLEGWPKEFEGHINYVTGDVDNDGKIEIIVATTTGIYIYSHDGSIVNAMLSDQQFQIEGGFSQGGLSLGDIDRDGKIEIVATMRHTDGWSYLHLFVREGMEWKDAEGYPVSSDWSVIKSEPWGYPLLGNLDMDTEDEISTSGGAGIVLWGEMPELYAYNLDGSIVEKFPKILDEQTSAEGLPIGDIDGDGKNEIICQTWKGSLFVWDSDGISGKDQWPVFHHDSQHTGFYTAPVDTVPPVIYNPQPNGDISNSNPTISVDTMEDAICKYDISDKGYDSMTNTFSSTGETRHSSIVGPIPEGNYIYYVRCIDQAGNKNPESAMIEFVLQKCSTWEDVIAKYQAYINDTADWEDVIGCYQQYISGGG